MSDAQSVASKFLKPKPKEEPTMSFAERAAMLMADDDEDGANGLVAGAKVEAKFGGRGKFYPGTIEAANPDGTFAILFDDGDKEPSAKPEHIKLVGGSPPKPASAPAPAAASSSSGSFSVGAKVECKFGRKGNWYPGVIEAENGDGTYAVLFDDGDKEPKAKPENLRPLGALASSGAADGLVAGAKVEAKFGGKGKFYPGTIEAANSDGTFAILFDDGDKEPSAKPEHVKLVVAPKPAPAPTPAPAWAGCRQQA